MTETIWDMAYLARVDEGPEGRGLEGDHGTFPEFSHTIHCSGKKRSNFLTTSKHWAQWATLQANTHTVPHRLLLFVGYFIFGKRFLRRTLVFMSFQEMITYYLSILN